MDLFLFPWAVSHNHQDQNRLGIFQIVCNKSRKDDILFLELNYRGEKKELLHDILISWYTTVLKDSAQNTSTDEMRCVW